MELFPAADEDQWSLIKKVIDDSDYYVLILGGRYGSIAPSGLSYTEMEYQYAVEIGKPVMGFIHADPGSLAAKHCETSDEGKVKLAQFRSLVQTKMCKMWNTPSELGSQVSRSLIKLIKSRPAVGWVRGNLVPSQSSAEEILGLRRKIEELERDILENKQTEPEEAADLAKGDDLFKLHCTFSARLPWEEAKNFSAHALLSWNQIFSAISPKLMAEIGNANLWKAMNNFLENDTPPEIKNDPSLKGHYLENFQIFEHDFETIKIQLRALGLIARSNEAANGSFVLWELTPYGDTVMTRLRAQRKPVLPIQLASSVLKPT